MRYAAMLAVLVVLVMMCACDRDGADLWLTEDDFGSHVRADINDVIHIALGANATTGYQWRCDWSPHGRLKLMDERYKAGGHRPGAGGVQHYVLRAMTYGKVVIKLQYGRPWKRGPREPERRITVWVER